MIVRYDEVYDYDFDDDLASYSAFCYEQEVEMLYASREAELYVDTPACYEANAVTCPWGKTEFCDRYDVYHCMCHCDDGTPEGAWHGPVIKDWEDEVEEFEYWQGNRERRGQDVWGDPELNEFDYANTAEAEDVSEWNREMDRLVAIERENEKRARRRQTTKRAKSRIKRLGPIYEAKGHSTKIAKTISSTRKGLREDRYKGERLKKFSFPQQRAIAEQLYDMVAGEIDDFQPDLAETVQVDDSQEAERQNAVIRRRINELYSLMMPEENGVDRLHYGSFNASLRNEIRQLKAELV